MLSTSSGITRTLTENLLEGMGYSKISFWDERFRESPIFLLP